MTLEQLLKMSAGELRSFVLNDTTSAVDLLKQAAQGFEDQRLSAEWHSYNAHKEAWERTYNAALTGALSLAHTSNHAERIAKRCANDLHGERLPKPSNV